MKCENPLIKPEGEKRQRIFVALQNEAVKCAHKNVQTTSRKTTGEGEKYPSMAKANEEEQKRNIK